VTVPQRGFKRVAWQLIHDRPGLTAEEYAIMARERGLAGSNSKDPNWSLATTLAKECREGRMPGIRAENVDGKRRYFPSDYHPVAKEQPNDGLPIQVILPGDVAKRVRDLLEIEKFNSPSEAATWLMEEGIKANQPALDQIANQLEEIRRRKESARRLL